MAVKGQNRLRKTQDFNRVHQNGTAYRTRGFTLKVAAGLNEWNRWGIITSRKIGHAVTRNRVRRMIREILRQSSLKQGYDLVVVTHPSIAEMNYHLLKERLTGLLSRAGLLKTGEGA